MENDFEAALPAVVSLRPGIFMENFLLSTDMIAKAGQIFVPIPGGKRWPMVATADIAAKAACWLLDCGWSGHHRVGVHGPKDLSSDEAAAIISSALGEPLKCVEDHARARDPLQALTFAPFTRGEQPMRRSWRVATRH
jgi:uncharacterized protein YbjT (DUF2867 family)